MIKPDYIRHPKIATLSRYLVIFSKKNQITDKDLLRAAVAIVLDGGFFKIVKNVFEKPAKKKLPLSELQKVIDESYFKIRLAWEDTIAKYEN
jgi:hypothetical protein